MIDDPAAYFADDADLDVVILGGRVHRRDGSSVPTPWPTTVTPTGWRVIVRCEADVHAPDSRPVVMVAECVGDGHGGPPWKFELRARSSWAVLDRGRGDPSARVLSPSEVMEGGAPTRVAYRLRCPACPENLPIADDFELFDRMNERAARRKRSDTLQAIRAARS